MEDAFFGPHGHIGDQFAARRVRAAGQAEFDVLLARTGDGQLHAYVNSAVGETALQEQPRLRVVRVAPGGLRIDTSDDGRRLHVLLQADDGPLRAADVRMVAAPGTLPRRIVHDEDPWGGTKHLRRIDLGLDGLADGTLTGASKKDVRELRNVACMVTVGSHVSRRPLAGN